MVNLYTCMSKVKVCHFYSGNRFGGLEKFLINVQRYSNMTPKVDHSFALCFEGKLFDHLQHLKNNVELIKLNTLSNPIKVVLAWVNIFKMLKRNEIDVLVSHEIWNYILGYFPAKLAGVNVVLWSHTSFFDYKLYKLLKYFLPQEIVADSLHVSELIKERWPSIPVKTLYYPHPSPEGVPAPKASNDIPTILYVGRFARYKGLHILIESLKYLNDLEFKLDIVGGPQSVEEEKYKIELETIIKKFNLQERVNFVGEQSDVASFYFKSDIFCHPNIAPEAFGLVFIEALYCGLPIVATNIGGAKEIFASTDKVIGKLVNPNQVEELSSSLRDMIVHSKLREEIKIYAPEVSRQLCDPLLSMQKMEDYLIRFRKK